MTESRTISIEAIALRETTMRKRAEQDALILQDDLLNALKQIDALNNEINLLKEKENGN